MISTNETWQDDHPPPQTRPPQARSPQAPLAHLRHHQAARRRPRPDQLREDRLREDRLHARLEASYEFHTEELSRLVALPVTDPEQALTRDSLMATSRQALTMIAAALRGMAEGRYGVCEGCGEPIPAEHLEARPEARYCDTCQAAPPGPAVTRDGFTAGVMPARRVVAP